MYYDIIKEKTKEKNMSLLNDDGIPLGLGMALAQNMDAMRTFSSMSESARQDVNGLSGESGFSEKLS